MSDPGGALREKIVSLSAAQIKSGLSSPIDSGLEKPGTGKAISFEGALIKFTANSTPFSSTHFNFSTAGSSTAQAKSATGSEGTILDSGNDAYVKVIPQMRAENQLVDNGALFILANEDSAGGDGTAIISILYRIASL